MSNVSISKKRLRVGGLKEASTIKFDGISIKSSGKFAFASMLYGKSESLAQPAGNAVHRNAIEQVLQLAKCDMFVRSLLRGWVVD